MIWRAWYVDMDGWLRSADFWTQAAAKRFLAGKVHPVKVECTGTLG